MDVVVLVLQHVLLIVKPPAPPPVPMIAPVVVMQHAPKIVQMIVQGAVWVPVIMDVLTPVRPAVGLIVSWTVAEIV